MAGKRKNKKRLILMLLTVFIIVAFGFVFSTPAYAASDPSWLSPASTGLARAVSVLVALIVWVLVYFLGLFLSLIMTLLINVAQFNDFINVPVVETGWKIVRDVCNMFFVLIFLVIAFSTILRYENYSAKRLLPKLLIMAVLINFSKTIFGLIIDMSQVIMLTFVKGFGTGANKLSALLGLEKMLSIVSEKETAATALAVAGGMIAGLLAFLVSIIVMAVLLVVLVMRVVMLWVYTILSPLVFLGFAFPPIQKYVGRIWEDFIKQVIVGPLLAFFLWLALTVGLTSARGLKVSRGANQEELCSGLNAFFCEDTFQTFIVVLSLLIGGLMVTQQIGGAAGSIAGKGMAAINKGKSFATGQAKTLGLWAGRKADSGQMWTQKKIMSGSKDYIPKSLNYRMVHEGFKRSRADAMRQYEAGKAGAWQDKLDRFTHQSVVTGVPISKKQREARAAYKNLETEQGEIDKQIGHKNNQIDTLKLQKGAATTDEHRLAIQADVDKEQEEITKLEERKVVNTSRIKKYKQASRRLGGQPPKDRHYKLEQKRLVNEEYSNINKEDMTEEELVEAYNNETRMVKKKAYLQHITAINGMNTLFASRKKEMNFENMKQFLDDEFKGDAGDVAVDISKIASNVGNYKMVGLGKFHSATGRNELTETNDEYVRMALTKQRERYDQIMARTTHNDTLVDRAAVGDGVSLSDLGERTLLDIANSPGKLKELNNGNFQSRFGQTVLSVKKDIQERITRYSAEQAPAEDKLKAKQLENVLEAFDLRYNPERADEVEEIRKLRKTDSTGTEASKDQKDTGQKRQAGFTARHGK